MSGLLVLVCAEKASALTKGKDTAGTNLTKAWTRARSKYPDALLMAISARTDASGSVLCDPNLTIQSGWRYTFFSRKADAIVVVAECHGRLAGPMRQFMARDWDRTKLSIKGRFIDSDFTLKLLKRSGVSLNPEDHKTGGKRPFSMSLARMEDVRFKRQPLLWSIEIGKSSYLVDAVKKEIFDLRKYVKEGVLTASTSAVSALALRPKRENVYTVNSGLDTVLSYAKRKFPGARLMAIEGFVDAWGSSPCTGAGDGWAYYFYYPRTKGFTAVYDCQGDIGPGPSQYVPVNLSLHKPLSKPFVDSSEIVDTLLTQNPSLMNEGMGRRYTRHGTLRLLNYRSSPFTTRGLWKTMLVWHLTLGRTTYRFDARRGIFIDVIE